MINGREYEFADITLIMGGRDVTGIRGIKYGEKQEKELLYGKGNRPLSVQKGNVSNEGELTVTQSEVESMKALARIQTGRSSLLGLNLNAVVCYGNPSQGEVMVTDRLYGMQFTEDVKDIKQGDKFMEIKIPFICADIDFQTI